MPCPQSRTSAPTLASIGCERVQGVYGALTSQERHKAWRTQTRVHPVAHGSLIRYVHQDIEHLRPLVDELAERYLEAAGMPSLPHDQEHLDEDRITV